MNAARPLAEFGGVLRPADHQTHHRLAFDVPPGCVELMLRFRYEPKVGPADVAEALARAALAARAERLAALLGAGQRALAEAYVAVYRARLFGAGARGGAFGLAPNLLTLSLDDAAGAYRGAAHRHAPSQEHRIGADAAAPGFLAGPLPAGTWRLTLTAHNVCTPECRYLIQIGAVSA